MLGFSDVSWFFGGFYSLEIGKIDADGGIVLADFEVGGRFGKTGGIRREAHTGGAIIRKIST